MKLIENKISNQGFSWSKERALRLLEIILLARLSDDKMSKLVKQNKGGTFHMPVTGHELVGAVCGLSLRSGEDWGLPYYRDRAFALGLGCNLVDLMRAFMARSLSHHGGGRMMPDHFSDRDLHIPCQSSVVGSQFLQAAGVALGVKLRGADEVVYVSGGEGATSQGDFHEALNFTSLHTLPLIFVIQDNGWAISVPLKEQTAGMSVAAIGRGIYGLHVEDIDGCNVVEVADAMEHAIIRGREGSGPTLIVAHVPRLCPHSSSDDPKKYKSAAICEEEGGRDPLHQYETLLIDEGLATQEEITRIHKALVERVEAASLEAERSPHPDPDSILDHLFKEHSSVEASLPGASGAPIVMIDAINHALDEEMVRDRGVIVFGQDVAHGKGGVFGATRHLTERHGPARCFNTPLAESTILGVATGLSCVDGFKPVVEIQFADYIWTGMNQLINELASIHYRSNGEWNCPVVVRVPCGGYIQGGPYHSQSIEGYLAHCPGLKIVMPSNSADAKRLLKAAIRDPNPVVFLEHKALYRQNLFCAKPEPSSDDIGVLGVANVLRTGSDLTVVAWGMALCMVADIVDGLEKEGISLELIDLRSLVPLDLETILNSVRKTGKLLIAHEASQFGGFGGEIAALVMQHAFTRLDAPIIRVGAKHCPVPYSKVLEDVVLPQKRDLEEAIRNLAHF